jgi:hypothetical protein
MQGKGDGQGECVLHGRSEPSNQVLHEGAI